MDAARLIDLCLFSPVPSPPRLSRSPASRVQRRQRASRASFVARRRQKPCLACGADTLVARSEWSSQALPSDKIRAEGADLKSWLQLHGLPPCKVDLKERPSHDGGRRCIFGAELINCDSGQSFRKTKPSGHGIHLKPKGS